MEGNYKICLLESSHIGDCSATKELVIHTKDVTKGNYVVQIQSDLRDSPFEIQVYPIHKLDLISQEMVFIGSLPSQIKLDLSQIEADLLSLCVDEVDSLVMTFNSDWVEFQ